MQILDVLLKLLGILFIIYEILKYLMKISKLFRQFVAFIKCYVYYPIVTRIIKQKHKSYVRDKIRSIIDSVEFDFPEFKYDIDISWSNEEKVEFDLDKNILIVRIPYAENLQRIIAKTFIMVAPYTVSEYLEPILGPSLARILTFSIAREYASVDPNILKELERLIGVLHGNNSEFIELMDYISKADDQSLFSHIILRELRDVLREFNGKVNKEKLEKDVKALVKVVGTLEDTPVPLVSGSYISVLIVRAGKLEKVMLEEWGRYVNFIQIHLQRHPNLRRVYLISAGAIIRDITKKLIDYVTNNVADLEFVDQVTYRARIYRGIPHMPRLVALFERK